MKPQKGRKKEYSDMISRQDITNEKLFGKLDAILEGQEEVKKMIQDHETRIRDDEKKIVAISERLTLANIGQATFTSIIGIVTSILAFTYRR